MMIKMIVMMLSCLLGGFLAEEQRDGRAVLVYEEFWDGSDDVTPPPAGCRRKGDPAISRPVWLEGIGARFRNSLTISLL